MKTLDLTKIEKNKRDMSRQESDTGIRHQYY